MSNSKDVPSGPTFNAAELAEDLQKVFRSGRTRPVQWRTAQLSGLLRLVEEEEEDLCEALKEDLGKPRVEAIQELFVLHVKLKTYIKDLPNLIKSKKVPVPFLVKPGCAEIRPEPLGVCLIISPWNFPVLLLLEPLMGALAAGNCVALKPSEVTPTVSATLARLIPKYIDPEAVRVAEGAADVATALLAQRWDHIFYTGGSAVGKIVMAAAAKHLTPVVLELGGKNPVIVDSTADVKVVATNVARAKCINMGQLCISPDYLLVEEKLVDPLVAELKKKLVDFYGEDPQKSGDLSRIVNTRHWERVQNLLSEEGVAAKIVHGGASDKNDKFIAPTIVRDPPMDSAIMQEEIFGPVLIVVTVKSVDEAIDIINKKPKPLALYAFTKSKTVQERVLNETSSGGVTLNDCIMHITVENLPFGGVGESGMGAYHGKLTFETFSHMKSVFTKPHTAAPELMLPPFTEKKVNIMTAALKGKMLLVFLILLGLRR